jgi:hypothetical protein
MTCEGTIAVYTVHTHTHTHTIYTHDLTTTTTRGRSESVEKRLLLDDLALIFYDLEGIWWLLDYTV